MSALGAFSPAGAGGLGASVTGLSIAHPRASASSSDPRSAATETERVTPPPAPSGVPTSTTDQSTSAKLATAEENDPQAQGERSEAGLVAEAALLLESRILGSERLEELFPSEQETLDGQEALEQQAARISELVQRFEEVLQRIDDFVNEQQQPPGPASSQDPGEPQETAPTGGTDPALIGLYSRADALFEDILLASKSIPGINGDAIQTALATRPKVSSARPRLNVVL